MLVLTRRIGEEIVIKDNIRVTVLSIRGGQIKLGITAPDNVHVVRSELIKRDRATEEGRNSSIHFQPARLASHHSRSR